MLAYHSDPKVKAKYVNRIKAHIKADDIQHGFYWRNGKGCAVGCTIEGSDHSAYEREIGIPEWLARVEDTLFEGMNNKKARTWPKVFLEAIKPGMDLESLKAPFMLLVLRNSLAIQEDNTKFDAAKNPEVVKVIEEAKKVLKVCIDLWKKGEPAWSAAWSAAESAAWSAWSAAESAAWSAAESAAWSAAESAARSAAESAAWSAESAAWSAAESAAWSAESAAWIAESAARSAAWSAESAAWSARSAAWSAESAAWSAAWSAESAAWSAESAARSAAWSAESAAWSAAWSAESAAESAAWSAAWSAESAAFDYYADELLKLIKACPAPTGEG